MTSCPRCHAPGPDLQDDVPAEGILRAVYVWCCGSCGWKWVTN